MHRRIDPTRPPSKPDGSPDDNDRVEIGPTALAFAEWAAAGLTPPDLAAMRRYRLDRLTAEIAARDLGGLLLFDPLEHPLRHRRDQHAGLERCTTRSAPACVAPDGHMVLWDYTDAPFLAAHNPLVAEVRSGASIFYFATGDATEAAAAAFAAEVADAVRARAGANRRLAVDKIMLAGFARARAARPRASTDGEAVDRARPRHQGRRGDPRHALRAPRLRGRHGGDARRRPRPGLSEDDVWAMLHAENIRRGGEWIETRLLASGPRTNPWFQECGPRVIAGRRDPSPSTPT